MSVHLDIPAAQYHAETGQYLTSGLLRDFLRSPQLFKDQIDGLVPRRETDAMGFGHALHKLVLEKNDFASHYAIKPAGMNFATKAGKAWKAAHKDREVVPLEDMQAMLAMVERMPEEIRRMFGPALFKEVTIRQKLGDLPAQVRVDCWDRDGNLILDLKTISAIERIDKSVWTGRYDIQTRFYQKVVELETGRRPAARLIFCETSRPFRWRVVELDLEYVMMADAEICAALERLHKCYATGGWSDKADLHEMISPPAWMRDTEDEDE